MAVSKLAVALILSSSANTKEARSKMPMSLQYISFADDAGDACILGKTVFHSHDT